MRLSDVRLEPLDVLIEVRSTLTVCIADFPTLKSRCSLVLPFYKFCLLRQGAFDGIAADETFIIFCYTNCYLSHLFLKLKLKIGL